MEQPAHARSRTATIVLRVLSILMALGIGLAGLAKLVGKAWIPLFASWGYPVWFSIVIGVVEVAGAIALLIPRTAFYGATLLAGVMIGALVTLQTHRGGALGWGATPLVYIVLLSIIALVRWSDRASRTATSS